MTNAVEHALRAFDEFVGAWVGPAAQRYVFVSGDTNADRVRQAIQAAAQTDDSRRIGWGVFQRALDTTYDRDRPSGFVYTLVSAVFEFVPTNVLEYCQQKKDGEFIICEITEMSRGC